MNYKKKKHGIRLKMRRNEDILAFELYSKSYEFERDLLKI